MSARLELNYMRGALSSKLWWEVKVWGESSNPWECGAHLGFTPGDTPTTVLDNFLTVRKLSRHELTSVEVYLRKMDHE